MSIKKLKIIVETTFDDFPARSIEAFVREAIKEVEELEKKLAESVPKSEIEKLQYKISIEEGWSIFLIIGELQKLLTNNKE